VIKKLGIENVVAVQTKQVSSLKPVVLKLEGFEQNFCFAVQEGHSQLLSQLNEGLASSTSTVPTRLSISNGLRRFCHHLNIPSVSF
jgi:hypothetical protein